MRALKNSFYIAFAYLKFYWIRTIILCFALALISFVPWFLNLALNDTQERLNARAETKALILGTRGSALELVLNSLYFNKAAPEGLSMQAVEEINRSKLAYAIPLNTYSHAGDKLIVGTSLDYFSFRNLTLKQGRQMGILGEAVLGARLATQTGLGPGDTIISSPENVFDISSSYPLELTIVGVLETTGSADDDVIFVDLKSSWVMAGLGHGHEDLSAIEDPALVERKEDKTLVARNNIKTYTVINRDNLDKFHFHGDDSLFPLSSALVIPKNERNATLLLGRYQGDSPFQLLEPAPILNDLISSIFRIKRVLDAVVWTVIFSTILTTFLVFLLTLRLREKEVRSMFYLGSSRSAITAFVMAEILIMLLISLGLASLFLFLSSFFRERLILELISG